MQIQDLPLPSSAGFVNVYLGVSVAFPDGFVQMVVVCAAYRGEWRDKGADLRRAAAGCITKQQGHRSADRGQVTAGLRE